MNLIWRYVIYVGQIGIFAWFVSEYNLEMDLIKLKEIRKFRKISLKELSETTGLGRERISRIERGKVNPSFDSVEKIAKALNVQIVIII